MSDPYAYWRAALAGVTMAVQDGSPQPGYYRMRKVRGGPWLPVAIWLEDGVAIGVVGDEEVAPRNVWLSCARFPVTEDDYHHRCDTGEWPGAIPDEVGPGDNRPPASDSPVAEVVNDACNRALAWIDGREIQSQADADRCEAFITSLTEARKAAEAVHRADKAPHLEAGRKVDAFWKPIIDRADSAVRRIKAALTPYLRAREAEKREAAAKAIAQGATAVRTDLKGATSGTHGRKVSLRPRKRADIKDYAAALNFFADHPDVRELVQRLADKVAGVGGTVPGVEIVTEQVAA